MQANGQYQAASNLAWLNPHYSTLAGIPYNKDAVLRMASHTFAKPGRFPFPLVVACKGEGFNPLDFKGALRTATPEEVLHAFYFAVARDVRAGANEGLLEQWRDVMVPASGCVQQRVFSLPLLRESRPRLIIDL